MTFIGTVSPAGGNLKEPVTESTKKAARCFYALEQNRADQKRYPAVNPVESYSKYLEYPEIQRTLEATVERGWIDKVLEVKNLVRRGKEMADQINILGDDGVPMSYQISVSSSRMPSMLSIQYVQWKGRSLCWTSSSTSAGANSTSTTTKNAVRISRK